MRELVAHLRDEKGMRVFLLSNICTYFAAHENEIPVLAEFEKRIYSAVAGRVKPNRDIFEYLCDTCGILPEETVFVDDNAANIAGADAFGIHGYLFDGDAKRLEFYLESLLSEV
jgi:HAD superfamily hydrolase (TIGR01509 family)